MAQEFLHRPNVLPLKRITSLTWSNSFSFGFGMNPDPGLDAFPISISGPIPSIKSY